jgi:hypothetical protein
MSLSFTRACVPCLRSSVVLALSFLSACSSSDQGSAPAQAGASNTSGGVASAGTAGAGTAGAGMTGAGTNSGGNETGGTPGGAGGGESSEPASCVGLQRDDAVQSYYMPPDTMTNWSVAGTYQDGQGVLLALHENKGLRLLAIDRDGTASELINETEYRPTWSFEPEEVFAFVGPNTVDLLVTDHADVALVHKQGTTVTITPLDETNFMDLHVLGFAQTASGMLALYWKGDRATGTDEILTAFDPSSMQKTTRTFHGDSGLVSITSASGAWLTAERLDATTDCQPTGQMIDCGGGETPVPSSDCTWHLDVWNITDKSFATADPALTVAIPATISPRCSDSTPLGLATYSTMFGDGPGVGSHHVTALDQRTQGLALAIQRPKGPGAPGLQFELLDASAKQVIDGTTTAFDSTEIGTWLAVRAGNLFLCSGDDCAMSTGSAASAFRFSLSQSMTVDARQVALRGDGLTLIGSINGNPLLQQHVSCLH